MPTRNKLISKKLQKKRAFEVYFISEVAETVAKRRKEGRFQRRLRSTGGFSPAAGKLGTWSGRS
jgi:hypothetical protein